MFPLSFKLLNLNSIILKSDNAILVCPRLTRMTFHSLSHPYHLLSPQLPCSPVISNLPSPPLFSCIILPLQLSSLNSPVPPPSTTILVSHTSPFLCSCLPSSPLRLGEKDNLLSGWHSISKWYCGVSKTWTMCRYNQCCDATYVHYKELSCDHSSMLIKQPCEDWQSYAIAEGWRGGIKGA